MLLGFRFAVAAFVCVIPPSAKHVQTASCTAYVSLSHASDHDITDSYSTTGITTGSGDFSGGNGTLTIAAGETTGEIRINLIDDDFSALHPDNPGLRRGEYTEYLMVDLSSSDPHAMIGVPYGKQIRSIPFI